MKITNTLKLPEILVPWLTKTTYTGDPKSTVFSATTLIRSVREIILTKRLNDPKLREEYGYPEPVADVHTFLRARIGQAIHTAIEETLVGDGVSKDDNTHVELRRNTEFNGVTITGQFDLVKDGTLYDWKTMSAEGAKYPRTTDYQLQASIYQWLFPELIVKPRAKFIKILLNWSSAASARSDSYPASPILEEEVPLLPRSVVEDFIRDKTTQLIAAANLDESDLPECTDAELWTSAPEYKYFKKAGQNRATKAFGTDKAAAYLYLKEQGGIGFVQEFKGEARKCLYCPAFIVCSQKDRLIEQGLLNVGDSNGKV